MRFFFTSFCCLRVIEQSEALQAIDVRTEVGSWKGRGGEVTAGRGCRLFTLDAASWGGEGGIWPRRRGGGGAGQVEP